jgi:hypothetical protein
MFVMQTEAPHSPEAAKIIQSSLDLSRWLFEHAPSSFSFDPEPEDVNEREAANERRTRQKVAVTLFQIALDHHTSVVLLCLNHMRSSAFALARCLFDSAWRGVWVAFYAPTKKLREFLNGTHTPQAVSKLQQPIENEDVASYFTAVYEKAWFTLCDYTHSGHLQIGRWMGEDEITPRHSDEEMEEVLRLCDQLALACAVLLTDFTNSDPTLIQNKYQELFDIRPGASSSS